MGATAVDEVLAKRFRINRPPTLVARRHRRVSGRLFTHAQRSCHVRPVFSGTTGCGVFLSRSIDRADGVPTRGVGAELLGGLDRRVRLR